MGMGQTGCPGCTIALPALPEDTIFLSAAADGQAGAYYNNDISFRMPKTTTPVAAIDPTVPAGLTIQQVTIASLTNLPPGLQWEANQLDFTPADQTDGCVKLCGIPLIPGYYEVEVIVTAQVLFVSQNSSFTFPIYIAPATSITEGFAINNSVGCGNIEAYFTNFISSNTQTGFSYHWDFGNGQTSTIENPGPQFYSQPGIYPVDYQAIVDTSGYFLTNILISEVGCTDLFSGPDLKVGVYTEEGEEVYLSNIISNAVPPLNFNLALRLDPGNYTLRVTDDDGGIDGADDICGVVNFNQYSNGTLTDTEMSVGISIVHPIDTIVSSDTVRVYEQPLPPSIGGLPNQPLCAGDQVLLNADYQTNIQWYRDSIPLLGANQPTLEVSESGQYWVSYISPDGCAAVSQPQSLIFNTPPEGIAFTFQNNLIRIYNPGDLPSGSTIQWFLNGGLIEGEEDITYCIGESGQYSLTVIDNQTGCSATYSQALSYNPNFPDCTTGTIEQWEGQWTIYPNPSSDRLWVDGWLGSSSRIEIGVFNPQGQQLIQTESAENQGEVNVELRTDILPSGVYFLRVRVGENANFFSFIKQ